MRNFAARATAVLLGLMVLALWLPASLFALLVAAVEGENLSLATRRIAVQTREMLYDFLNLVRFPLNDGADSGV